MKVSNLSRVVLSTLAVSAYAGFALAQAAETLSIEPDARQLAMGSAGAGLADDVDAVFWNPAGLAFQRSLETSFSMTTLREETQFRRIAGRYATQTGNAVGISMWSTRWSSRPCLRRLGWGRCRYDARDLALSLSLAHRIGDKFSVGTSVKRFRMKRWYDDQGDFISRSEWAFAFDLAVLYRTTLSVLDYPLSAGIGANLANVGRSVAYGFPEEEHVLPSVLRVGANLGLALDTLRTVRWVSEIRIPLEDRKAGTTLDEAHFSEVSGGVGVEYPLDKVFTIRGGLALGRFQMRRGVHPTMGGGLSVGAIRLDVAFVTGFEPVHVVTEDVLFTLRVGREDTTMPPFPRGEIPWKVSDD